MAIRKPSLNDDECFCSCAAHPHPGTGYSVAPLTSSCGVNNNNNNNNASTDDSQCSGNVCPPRYSPIDFRQTTTWAPCLPPSCAGSAFSPYCPAGGPISAVPTASTPYPSPPLSHGRPASSCGGLGSGNSAAAASAMGFRWSPTALTADEDDNSWSSFADLSSTSGTRGFDDSKFDRLSAERSFCDVSFGQRNNNALSAYTGRHQSRDCS